MPKDSIKRLASVLEKHMDIQFAQEDEARDNDRDYNSHTTNELIKFALEEAYQNGELDFLAPSTGELRAKLYAQSSFDLGSSDDDNYRMSIDAGLDKNPSDFCAWCGQPMYALVRAHHHTETVDGVLQDVTTIKQK